MDAVKGFWIKLTPTRALDQNCKKLERDFFEFTYRFTYLMGFSSFERNIFYDIYSGIVKLIIYSFIFSELCSLFKETSSLNVIIDNIHVTLIHIVAVYRHKNMVSNRAFYKELASSMQSPHFDISTKERRAKVRFWARMNEKYLKLLLTLGLCTVTIWLIYPLVDDIPYNLFLALYLPYDYKRPIPYAITYFVLLVAFNFIAFYVMINDIVLQAYLIHLLCQYKVLANGFENILADSLPKGFLRTRRLINTNKFKTKFLKRFDNLVNQHIFILENTMKLKKSLSFPMFCQLTSSGLLICFAGYQVTLAVKLSITKLLLSLLYLGYNIFELYIFCRWCDDIKIQSENIANAVYFSKWECSIGAMPGVRSRILLVIARSQKTVAFSASGLSDLSLVTFTTANFVMTKNKYTPLKTPAPTKRVQIKYIKRSTPPYIKRFFIPLIFVVLMKTSYSALTVLLRFQD